MTKTTTKPGINFDRVAFDNGFTVLLTRPKEGAPRVEWDACARLIAAAPEMRNELNNVLHGEQDVLDLHAALNCKGEHCEFDELIETFARVRALLARIDGTDSAPAGSTGVLSTVPESRRSK